MANQPVFDVTPSGKGIQAKWIDELVSLPEHDRCVPWPFYIGARGYGMTTVANTPKGAHRRVCELAHGPAPFVGAHAAHSCGNRECVNPKHLRWATPSGNFADKHKHGTRQVGELGPSSKLTNKEVIAIRRTRRDTDLTLKEIAEKFGVSLTNVSMIANRKTWTHIP